MDTVVINYHSWGFKTHPHNHHKRLLYALQGRICHHCIKKFKIGKLTIDHIIARTDGGSNDFMNKQLLCLPCHRGKTDWENEERNRKWREQRQTNAEYIPINNEILAAHRLF